MLHFINLNLIEQVCDEGRPLQTVLFLVLTIDFFFNLD